METKTLACSIKTDSVRGLKLKGLKIAEQWNEWVYEPNGELAREPVERVAPYLNKYDAVISNSMVEFAPKSLSVAFIIAISSFMPDFLLTPA